MKTNILQIILGIVIAAAAAVSIKLDPNGFYPRVLSEMTGRLQTVTMFNPDIHEVIATVLAYFVVLFAILITIIAAASLKPEIHAGYVTPDAQTRLKVKNLAMAQTGLVLAVTICAFLVTIWGFPTSYEYRVSETMMRAIEFTPGRSFVYAMGLSAVTFLLGLVLVGFSIARQISTGRRKTTFHSNQQTELI
jgi:hypothetical protein